MACPDASDAEAEAAARTAHAHDFIVRDLPHGYETRAGGRGTHLCGGRRQRLAHTRALLADAPVLVLDEAVSNLDTESEAAVDRPMSTARTTHLHPVPLWTGNGSVTARILRQPVTR
ncbi:hypothetical protein [Streptomyces sp. SA15]|uniref:hypothetical protein n=1 Tax=Streptomyces sp. SA15 TaxID=934019 RepID=UPI00359C8D80